MFFRLIVNCDDYGRMDARPAILKARLFPLKTVTEGQIAKALQSLRSAAIIDLYEVDGRSFLQMRTWEKHQQVRAKRSKYPAPESGIPSSDIICNQVQANVPVIQSESESESESESNPNTKGKRTRFDPPTPEEVQAYFIENGGTHIQAVRFKAYYDSNGWKVGKNPMKDWKAAVRGWIARDKDSYGGDTMQRHQYTPEQYRAMITDLDAEDDSGKPKGKDGDRLLRYSKEERKATYSAAVIDFDEV